MSKIIKGILLLFNLMVILSLLLVKVGTFIPPNKFVYFTFFAYALIPIIIMNIGFVLLWIFTKKWYFLLSLITLLLLHNTINGVVAFNFASPKIPQNYGKIKVLSYNVMGFNKQKKHTKKHPNKIVQHILDANADIVCLQEMGVAKSENLFNEDDYRKTFKKYPYRQFYVKSTRWSRKIGICTLSKYPIINKKIAPYDAIFNGSIYSDILIGTDTFRVINNHLESNRITSTDMKETKTISTDFSTENFKSLSKKLSKKITVANRVRAKQAQKVRKIITNSPYRTIVCGDFNDVPESYVYTVVKGNLKDSFKETGLGTSFSFAKSFYRFRIDYILCDTSFIVGNYTRTQLKASDHYPINADLYYKK